MQNKFIGYFFLSTCLISPSAFGFGELEDSTNARYQKTATIIINAINEDSTDMIPFSVYKNKIISDYGYDKFLKYYHERFGRITRCGSPTLLIEQVKFQIVAEKGRWSMIVDFVENGLVDGLAFVEPDPNILVPMCNSRTMRLPFRGDWLVRDGGPSIEMNRHMKIPNDKFLGTVDFSMMDNRGYAFDAIYDGSKNEHYYSFGKDVLAVADGEVVTVVNGVPDNRPYSVNLMSISGNTVILKHAEHEFSLYAHLKLNSTRVKVGQKVTSGQILAQCGNSGQSTGPHLHFALVNTEVDSDAHGFLPYFNNVIVARNGFKQIQNDYTPLRGDRVQHKE